jgi:histidinol-phosphate aminotransferase
MSRYWSPLIARLEPYVAGEQIPWPGLVKLNTNECPYPPSPRVLDAIHAESGDSLRLYPDPNSTRLRQALARRFAVDLEQVFVGNGSDEVLAHAFHALLSQDRPTLFPDVTYSFYPVYCRLYGIEYRAVPVTGTLEIDLHDYGVPNGGIIFANPNAPTGTALGLDQIESLLVRNADSVVVIDEAYADLGVQSAAALVNRYSNLLVVQTFSKARSLAGMRIGFALGHKDLIEALDRVKNSFNSYPLSRLASAAAIASIEDQDYFLEVTRKVVAARTELSGALRGLGFHVIPSAANFVFARHPRHDAAALYRRLKAQGILVRHFPAPRTEQYLRITVGTPEQCGRLVDALRDMVGDGESSPGSPVELRA